jgi:hypothetical protein
MGFFSWTTQDTGRSICNNHSGRPTFRVVMTDNKGNRWVEDNYNGYGVFGGKPYHELTQEMNADRGDQPPIYPSLSECGEYYNGVEPEWCKHQGFFY